VNLLSQIHKLGPLSFRQSHQHFKARLDLLQKHTLAFRQAIWSCCNRNHFDAPQSIFYFGMLFSIFGQDRIKYPLANRVFEKYKSRRLPCHIIPLFQHCNEDKSCTNRFIMTNNGLKCRDVIQTELKLLKKIYTINQ